MIKIGIVGSGFGLYGLLPAFNSTKGCKVISICGKKSERLLSYCESIGLQKIYTDWQEMLDKEKLDAVAIAVTPNAQYEIAKVAIGKGLHIFAEKPLSANYKQAKELQNLALKWKIISAVDFIFPEIEEWKKVKQLLETKKYGKLKHISANWDFLSYDIKNKLRSWKTDVSQGGGALSFYFSHSLYYLEYFAGKILKFKGKLSYSKESLNGGDVGVDLELEFENEISGTAHLSCNARDLNEHQLKFICEKGRIILRNENSFTSNFSIKISKGGKEKIILSEEKNTNDEDERVRVVKKIAKRFIEAINRKKKFVPSFKEGVRVQDLIEKIRINTAKELKNV